MSIQGMVARPPQNACITNLHTESITIFKSYFTFSGRPSYQDASTQNVNITFQCIISSEGESVSALGRRDWTNLCMREGASRYATIWTTCSCGWFTWRSIENERHALNKRTMLLHFPSPFGYCCRKAIKGQVISIHTRTKRGIVAGLNQNEQAFTHPRESCIEHRMSWDIEVVSNQESRLIEFWEMKLSWCVIYFSQYDDTHPPSLFLGMTRISWHPKGSRP